MCIWLTGYKLYHGCRHCSFTSLQTAVLKWLKRFSSNSFSYFAICRLMLKMRTWQSWASVFWVPFCVRLCCKTRPAWHMPTVPWKKFLIVLPCREETLMLVRGLSSQGRTASQMLHWFFSFAHQNASLQRPESERTQRG